MTALEQGSNRNYDMDVGARVGLTDGPLLAEGVTAISPYYLPLRIVFSMISFIARQLRLNMSDEPSCNTPLHGVLCK